MSTGSFAFTGPCLVSIKNEYLLCKQASGVRNMSPLIRVLWLGEKKNQ